MEITQQTESYNKKQKYRHILIYLNVEVSQKKFFNDPNKTYKPCQ